MNLLHDISPGTADEVNVIIEVPHGSYNKYEIDKETGLISLNRANYNQAPFPLDYGFVPQTWWDDGDALDVVVMATFPIPQGILVKVRPVALMEMTDTGEPDSKLIAVPTKDQRWSDVHDLADIHKHTVKEIAHFFETYKQIKGDEVVVHGFKPRADAVAAFDRSTRLYKEKFGKR